MQKMLIHCQGSPEHGEQIKSFLETRLPYEVSISFDKKMTHDLLLQRPTNLLLYESNIFAEADLQLIKDLRGQGFFYPSLIVAKTFEIQNRAAVLEKCKAHFMEKPFEFKALRGVTQKLMLSRAVPQQMHKRFATQQNAVIEPYNTSDVINSQMFNLSVSGAYCEFANKARLAIGDLVKVRINLDDIARERSVNARVIWTTRKPTSGTGSGIGLRFVKSNDVYQQIMDKL